MSTLKHYQYLFSKYRSILSINLIVSLLFIILGIIFQGVYFMLLVASHIMIVISVVQVMGYQYNTSTVDYYYSLPITRKKLFLKHQIVSYFLVLIPLCVAIIISLFLMPIGLLQYISVLASTFFVFMVCCLITTLSNNTSDSLILISCYYIIPVIGTALFISYLNVTLNGFLLSYHTIQSLIRLVTFYIDTSINLNFIQLGIYIVWFVVLNVTVCFAIYYFVSKRKVEQAGGGFPHKFVYSFIKIILIYIYLLFVSIIVQNVLEFNHENLIYLLFYALIGLVIFLILTVITTKSFDKIISTSIKYLLVVLSFISLSYGYHKVKYVLYEQRLPMNMESVQMNLFALDNNNTPFKVIDTLTNTDTFEIKDPAFSKITLELHKSLMDKRNKIYYGKKILFKYRESNNLLPLVRKYYIDDLKLNNYWLQVINETEYLNEIAQYFSKPSDVKVYEIRNNYQRLVVECPVEKVKDAIITTLATETDLSKDDVTKYQFEYDGKMVELNIYGDTFIQALNL